MEERVIGHARVPSFGQDLKGQLDLLKKESCDVIF
ncbi:hypothetical protein SAMN05421791_101207 [Facklamia miroungae]|uniref:Resolvase/invertase-type recombinase catalytic domain-containing protein n=1 Tax=Facklamia miroungae TaxID=120956 RepID=A0A1G7PCS1_9LACT|nr:hypothetical protein SAMN05421791_101207 [Facklamia miroungae]